MMSELLGINGSLCVPEWGPYGGGAMLEVGRIVETGEMCKGKYE